MNTTPSNVIVLGNVGSSDVTRVNCTSSRILLRELWTCGKTEVAYTAGHSYSLANTVAWTDFVDGVPTLEQSGPTNQSYYPLGTSECNPNTTGVCPDGTFWSLSVTQPPIWLTSSSPSEYLQGYTWISSVHRNTSSQALNNSPAISMYSLVLDPAHTTSLPVVTLVNEAFFPGSSPSYGTYGTIVQNLTSYLYGQLSDGSVALARTPSSSMADSTGYEFYVGDEWTSTIPLSNDTSAAIPNVGTGAQGTIYYSELWMSYVWIGGDKSPGATFHISTAPNPEGPWTQPTIFYTAAVGNAFNSTICVAHPGLTDGSGRDIYLTFTNTTDSAVTTPLIHIQWFAENLTSKTVTETSDSLTPEVGPTASSPSSPTTSGSPTSDVTPRTSSHLSFLTSVLGVTLGVTLCLLIGLVVFYAYRVHRSRTVGRAYRSRMAKPRPYRTSLLPPTQSPSTAASRSSTRPADPVRLFEITPLPLAHAGGSIFGESTRVEDIHVSFTEPNSPLDQAQVEGFGDGTFRPQSGVTSMAGAAGSVIGTDLPDTSDWPRKVNDTSPKDKNSERRIWLARFGSVRKVKARLESV